LPNELTIPDQALSDPKARELIRIWAAHGQQHVTIQTGLWPDPGSWGIMLADLVMHITNAYVQEGSSDAGVVTSRILEAFNAEIEWPTDKPIGKVGPSVQ
jgi:uncharacterized protein DUF5076